MENEGSEELDMIELSTCSEENNNTETETSQLLVEKKISPKSMFVKIVNRVIATNLKGKKGISNHPETNQKINQDSHNLNKESLDKKEQPFGNDRDDPDEGNEKAETNGHKKEFSTYADKIALLKRPLGAKLETGDDIDNAISGYKFKVDSLQLEIKRNRKDYEEKLHSYADRLEVIEGKIRSTENQRVNSNKDVIYQLEKMRIK